MAVSTTEWDVNGRMKYTRINQRKLILITENKKAVLQKDSLFVGKSAGIIPLRRQRHVSLADVRRH